MSIKDKLLKIKSALPEHVTLVAVSKTKPISDLTKAYNAGQRVFGENKIQEMTEKWEQMPKDIQWHMIGHVQTNKVKFMAPYVSLIHGVDSLKLLEEINAYARAKDNRVRQVSVSLAGEWQAVSIIRPDTGPLFDVRPLVRLDVSIVVGEGERQESGHSGIRSSWNSLC